MTYTYTSRDDQKRWLIWMTNIIRNYAARSARSTYTAADAFKDMRKVIIIITESAKYKSKPYKYLRVTGNDTVSGVYVYGDVGNGTFGDSTSQLGWLQYYESTQFVAGVDTPPSKQIFKIAVVIIDDNRHYAVVYDNWAGRHLVYVTTDPIEYPTNIADYEWVRHADAESLEGLIDDGVTFDFSDVTISVEYTTDHDWVQAGPSWICADCGIIVASESRPARGNCAAVSHNLWENDGYDIWANDLAGWQYILSTTCPSRTRLGIMQLDYADYSSLVDLSGDLRPSIYYTESERLVPGTHGKTIDYGGTIDPSIAVLPGDTDRLEIDNVVIPWRGINDGIISKRFTSEDIINFYNYMTSNNSYNADFVYILVDGGLYPNYTYTNADGTPPTQESDTRVDLGHKLSDEWSDAVCYFRKIKPPGGFTPTMFKHPIIDGSHADISGMTDVPHSWLYFLRMWHRPNWPTNNFLTYYHLTDSIADKKYWLTLAGSCPGVEQP